jgi:hypothetical protein
VAGIGELLATAGQATTDELAGYLELRGAVVRLLDPRALGAFSVVLAARGVAAEPPLAGLAFRLPRRPRPPTRDDLRAADAALASDGALRE